MGTFSSLPIDMHVNPYDIATPRLPAEWYQCRIELRVSPAWKTYGHAYVGGRLSYVAESEKRNLGVPIRGCFSFLNHRKQKEIEA